MKLTRDLFLTSRDNANGEWGATRRTGNFDAVEFLLTTGAAHLGGGF
jgi:hypothetical protein